MCIMQNKTGMRIQCLQPPSGRFHFRLSDFSDIKYYLPLKIAVVHDVKIHYSDGADAGGSKVE